MSAPLPGSVPPGPVPPGSVPPGWYREGPGEIERFWDGHAWTAQRRLGRRPVVGEAREKVRWAGVAWGARLPELSLVLGILVALLGLPMLVLLPFSVSGPAGVMNAVIGLGLVVIGAALVVDAAWGFRLRRARQTRPW